MQTDEIRVYGSSSNGSSSSQGTPNNQLDLNTNGVNGALRSSSRSDGTPKTRTIAIAVEAHRMLKPEPFIYAINHLVEQKNCRVVVICCLSKLQDPMGVDHPVDVQEFTGINEKVLQGAINSQLMNMNHFLTHRGIRGELEQRGVQLDLRIAAGRKRDDILVQAVKALHPHWVVLDRSFSGRQKPLQEQMECNLVLMKKPPDMELIKLSTDFLGPVLDELPASVQEPGRFDENPASSSSKTESSSSYGHGSGTRNTLQASVRVRAIASNQSTISTSSTKSYTCFTCLCLSPGVADDNPSTDGPTRDRAVLYGETASRSNAEYLGQMPPRATLAEEPVILSINSSQGSSPSGWFNGSTSKSSRKTSVKMIEASMAMRQDEVNREYYNTSAMPQREFSSSESSRLLPHTTSQVDIYQALLEYHEDTINTSPIVYVSWEELSNMTREYFDTSL